MFETRHGLVQWPRSGPGFGRSQALLYTKFSIIFAQNGRWNVAEELQLRVKQYTDSVLGLGQPPTRRITLALALTYWSQGRSDEAADLQNAVLQACLSCLGPDNVETLMTMDLLGQTRWQQGRYSEARILQERAVDGLVRLKGLHHEVTLSAMGGLGRSLAKFYENLDEATRYLRMTHEGLCKILGPTHLKTLVVQEDLAMLHVQREESLSLAAETMQQILDCRQNKLGKEHPYVLLAMVNLARAYAALVQHGEAEILVRNALSIADRNLGEDHIGTLMGRTVLGNILIRGSRFSEAEMTLLGVIEKQRNLSSYRGDFHPDRIGAMIELAWCYELQGRFDEGIQICDEAIQGLQRISLKQHPLERKMNNQKQKMVDMKLAKANIVPDS